MGIVGTALRTCRMEAKPKKLTQQKVADEVNLVVSYISKIETDDNINPNFSKQDIQKLTRLFRNNGVSEEKITDFIQSSESARVTGKGASDDDAVLVQRIYGTLHDLDESKRLAYRRELLDRNDIWHRYHQTVEDFRNGVISKFKEVMKILEVLEEMEDRSPNDLTSRLRLENSRIHRYLGEIRLAKTKLSQALELARTTKDNALLAEILIERGDFYRRSDQGNLRAAIHDYQEARDIIDESGKASAQIRIASIFLTAGQPKDALQPCEDSLKYAQFRRDQYLERKSLEYKAWALSMLGDLDKAIRLQLNAHEIAKESSIQPKELAKSSTYLAGFYLMCGLTNEAERYYLEADKYVDQLLGSEGSDEEKEIFIRGLIYLGLGTIKTQRPDERINARSYLRKSFDFAHQSNDSLTIGRSLKQLGELDVVEEALVTAQDNFESAKLLFQKYGLEDIGNPYYLSSLGFDFVELEYKSKNHLGVSQHLKEIESLASQFGYREHLIRCQLWNTRLLALGDLHTNKNKIVDLYFSMLKDAISTDPHILRNSLGAIMTDLERFYKEGQQVEIISIAKKMVSHVAERLSINAMRSTQAKELESWVRNLQSRASEWDVLEKTLRPMSNVDL